MDNRETAIDIYNRLNRWSHGALTDFAVGIIEEELDNANPECAKNTERWSATLVPNHSGVFFKE